MVDSAQTVQLKKVLEELDRLSGTYTTEDDVVFTGTQIVLPETMETNPQEAINFLQSWWNDQEEQDVFRRTYPYRPWDGAVSAHRALKKLCGVVRHNGTNVTVPVGVDETLSVPWGMFKIPILDKCTFSFDSAEDEKHGLIFQVRIQAPKKWKKRIAAILDMIGEECKNSIYRGKAFDGKDMPEFLDLRAVDPKKVVYSESVIEQLNANVWSLLKHTDKMRALGLPLKRTVVFEGPYGTGKTLGAFLTAQIAVENGWTFLYARPGQDDLASVLSTAELYQPSVVFFEDLDVIGSPEALNKRVSKLLDTFDGLQSKTTEIVMVLTTNHVDQIHKGMTRPGRVDAFIHIGALDPAGVERMARSLVPEERLSGDIDWGTVGLAMDGFLPAFVKECIDRTTRYSIARNNGEVGVLVTDDFVRAAEGLRPQLDLMNDAKDRVNKLPLDEAMVEVIHRGLEETVSEALNDLRNDMGL